MISLHEAKKIVTDNVTYESKREMVELHRSLNRLLAADITSDINFPPFNKSTMDGYACKREDLSNELTVIETIMAGQIPQKEIKTNCAAKIMTGAMVPVGADCVVMVEQSNNPKPNTVKFVPCETLTNITNEGEYIKKGDVVLKAGTVIRPQEISILASVGASHVNVFAKPIVGVISTGDELIDPSETPTQAKLRDSNIYKICSQIERAGANAIYYGIAKDKKIEIEELYQKAKKECDIVLLSGGVSMGDLDLVKVVLLEKCRKIFFETIAIKPGKPTIFGIDQDRFIFGLPGNPISSFVIFELLVRPLICKMMCSDFTVAEIVMPLGDDLIDKHSDRERWIPVKLIDGVVVPISYGGSGHVNALTLADGLISIPIGIKEIKKGTDIHVRSI